VSDLPEGLGTRARELYELLGRADGWPEFRRFTAELRRQGILRDGPAGSRLVLDPGKRRPPAVAGAPEARTWRRGDPELTRVVAADRAAGFAQAQIAAKRGVHVQTVRRHLARSGLVGRNSMTPDQGRRGTAVPSGGLEPAGSGPALWCRPHDRRPCPQSPGGKGWLTGEAGAGVKQCAPVREVALCPQRAL
jgi:hypothetical protein